MLRRLFSLCLVACLLLGLGTMTVSATQDQEDPAATAATESVATETVTDEPVETETVATEPAETTPVEPEAPVKPNILTSDDAIEILKLEEGFSTYPYWDYAQWTVGYGTRCPDDKLEEYRKNGIPQEEADILLREFVLKFEAEISKFMAKNNLQLEQNQFDALLLFSYNCGTGWAHDSGGGIYNAIAKGATGNELINAFARWCNAGGEIKTFLLRRRLCEANMYLNGVYSQTPPSHYGYVLYDACGGTAKPNVQGYDANLTAEILSTASRTGYKFLGWYTAKTGGTKVERLDASTRNARLYARWEGQEETVPEEPETQNGIKVTVTANSLNVRSGAGTNYAVVGSVNTGKQVVITQTAENGGILWGKFSGGWIALNYTNYDILTAPEEEPPAPVTKTGTVRVNDTLRVRSGPSTGYDVVKYLKNGDKVEILEEKVVGTMVWGKISDGWISMDYVVIDREEEPPTAEPPQQEPPKEEPPKEEPPAVTPPAETPEAEQKVRTGKIKVSDVLRIRSGPSTDNAVVGYLKAGEKVTITEQTSAGNMTWGKISNGWISMDYVELDPDTTEPAKPLEGTVQVSDLLRVRSGPGTSYPISAYLKNGDKVEITERRTVNGAQWGKIAKGWISLDYVKLEQTQQTPQEPQKTTKTVTADCLRVRSVPGTSGTVVGYLYRGAKVEILETQTVNGTVWGKTTKGWISLDYVK